MTMSPATPSPSMNDANFMLSPEITLRITDEVQALWGNPKYEYLRKEFLSKFVSHETDPAEVRRARALEKWLEQEKVNFFTNLKLRRGYAELQIMPGVTWDRFIQSVRKTIGSIIGETLPLEVLYGSFSSGASTSRPRAEGHPALKYIGRADITPAAESWWRTAQAVCPLWHELIPDHGLRSVSGNEFFTVPKKTDIDRACCKEPDINMYLQKGVGDHIRKCLKRFGIDLNDQTRNQELAREGADGGHLATIDLSSASDSVTLGLVELIFPKEWLTLLMDLRSPETRYKRRVEDAVYETHVNEMLSSMGNGFTFEVESLIFFAIARAVAWFNREDFSKLSVYGDDIICPSTMYDDLVIALKYSGFTVNAKKSFASGPFRESCGKHYHHRQDVTPFYIRKPIERLSDLILLLNGIRKWSGSGGTTILDPVLESFWYRHSVFVPRCLWGGRNLGANDQLVTPDRPKSRLIARTVDREVDDLGNYLFWMNSCSDRPVFEPTHVRLVHNGVRLNPAAVTKALAPVKEAHVEVTKITEDAPEGDFYYQSVKHKNSILFDGPLWLHEQNGMRPARVMVDEPLLFSFL
ncbi:RNA-directed RNA polymerase [ssRNA phage AIN002]|uniref:RNA-directed RNA polymerase n=1 Tax=ssRNA phage AIN002 TaxID=2785985 RepID=A0A8S5KX72_9VIRU|nr:RNA-directed RNA polymerase [ssRNA phage AIN002]DAD49846.1 TPA_asm: RNA-directed RNA polymerase [ssRNA phage AIN002]